MFDVILSDYRLHGFTGLQALEVAHEMKPDLPFIFVSGAMGEDVAIRSFVNGATDYVLKDRLTRLPSAIRRAVEAVSERRIRLQLQARLQEAARLEAIGTLASGIAHDFNNILAIILGQASLFALESHDPKRGPEIAGVISQAARRGAKIVEELMVFAKKSPGNLVMMNLNQRVADFLVGHQKGIPEKVTVSFLPDQEIPTIFANPHHLEGILVKLIDNAVEAMPDGGFLSLSTSLLHADQMADFPQELARAHYVCLKVADTGKGIDPKVRQHVFEPFYTTKERGRGTGLGLPVVYGLMQDHNGLVNIDSEPGKGTTVSLFFPVKGPVSAAKAPTGPLPQASLRGSATVLIIEDEEHVCTFLKTVLGSYGYQVLVAHNHPEALAHFKAHRQEIQVVLSDIGLPKVDGITICSELKTLKPTLKIIMSSGYSYQEFKTRLDELQIDAFVSKPSTPQTILKTVREVLGVT